jgi:hypothetical protein
METILTPSLPVRRTGRITPQIAEAVADMVAMQMTETEAVTLLGINPRAWFLWKDRAKNRPKFEALLTRVRAGKIKSLISEVTRAATGADGVRHDWRAADRLLAVTAPERYAQARDSQAPVSVQVSVTVGRMQELVRLMAEGRVRPSVAIAPAGETPRLAGSTPSAPDIQCATLAPVASAD